MTIWYTKLTSKCSPVKYRFSISILYVGTVDISNLFRTYLRRQCTIFSLREQKKYFFNSTRVDSHRQEIIFFCYLSSYFKFLERHTIANLLIHNSRNVIQYFKITSSLSLQYIYHYRPSDLSDEKKLIVQILLQASFVWFKSRNMNHWI